MPHAEYLEAKEVAYSETTALADERDYGYDVSAHRARRAAADLDRIARLAITSDDDTARDGWTVALGAAVGRVEAYLDRVIAD